MKETIRNRRWLAPVLVVAAVVLVAAGVGVGVMVGRNAAEAEVAERPTLGEDGRIGYATAGVVATDPETLQDMVDEMYEKAKEPGIALEYKNVMVSEDGVNFDCFIGNSADNAYDMFITIYSDQALTDELYLSELLRPGTRFEKVTFQKKLDPGEYKGYVVYTQVADEKIEGQETLTQTIHAQVATTIDIMVREPS